MSNAVMTLQLWFEMVYGVWCMVCSWNVWQHEHEWPLTCVALVMMHWCGCGCLHLWCCRCRDRRRDPGRLSAGKCGWLVCVYWCVMCVGNKKGCVCEGVWTRSEHLNRDCGWSCGWCSDQATDSGQRKGIVLLKISWVSMKTGWCRKVCKVKRFPFSRETFSELTSFWFRFG